MTSGALNCRRGRDSALPGEARIVLVLLAFGVVLRLIYAWHYRIDSDEPQHLHVVWAWTQGLLPYRDVFDNHAPLFQALYAPLFAWFGVRPDILLPMRVAELPIYALTILCVWRITGALFGGRVGLWTAVLAAFLPPFFLISLEFRPDQLWALAWLLVLWALCGGRATPRRAFWGGLALGLAFAVSMKTVLCVAAMVFALAGAWWVRCSAGPLPPGWRSRLIRCGGSALVGMLVVPVPVVLFFWFKGSGPQMLDCVIRHNVMPDEMSHPRLWHCAARLSLVFIAAAAGAIWVHRLDRPAGERARIAFVYLCALLYFGLLTALWPILTDEDFLPFYPALMLSLGPLAFAFGDRLLRWRAYRVVGVILVTAEIGCIFWTASPFRDETADKVGIVADVLKLTGPEDYVMDGKGETIYRRRPYYYVLEAMTFRRLSRGLVVDDVAQRLVATRTPVATLRRMPKAARPFIRENYVPVAFRLRVVGKLICEEGETSGQACVFDIAVPQRYTLVTPDGQARGTLDGTPFTGPRVLEIGRHEFVPDRSGATTYVIWAQAIERGYSPFTKLKRDHPTPQD